MTIIFSFLLIQKRFLVFEMTSIPRDTAPLTYNSNKHITKSLNYRKTASQFCEVWRQWMAFGRLTHCQTEKGCGAPWSLKQSQRILSWVNYTCMFQMWHFSEFPDSNFSTLEMSVMYLHLITTCTGLVHAISRLKKFVQLFVAYSRIWDAAWNVSWRKRRYSVKE